MKRKITILSIGAIALYFCFSYFWKNIYSHSFSTLPISSYSENLFHPDSVLGISINTKGEIKHFKRDQRLIPFSEIPEINQKLQFILSEFSTLQLFRIDLKEITTSPLMEISLKFDDFSESRLAIYHSSFVWLKGPFTGLGGGLSELNQIKFSAPDLFFKTMDYKLCESRLTKLFFKTQELSLLNFAWVINGKKIEDQNLVEKFMGKNCTLKIVDFSRSEFKDPSKVEKFELINLNGLKIIVRFNAIGLIEINKPNEVVKFLDPIFAAELKTLKAVF